MIQNKLIMYLQKIFMRKRGPVNQGTGCGRHWIQNQSVIVSRKKTIARKRGPGAIKEPDVGDVYFRTRDIQYAYVQILLD